MEHQVLMFHMINTYLNDAIGNIANLQSIKELEDGIEIQCRNGDVVTIKSKKDEN